MEKEKEADRRNVLARRNSMGEDSFDRNGMGRWSKGGKTKWRRGRKEMHCKTKREEKTMEDKERERERKSCEIKCDARKGEFPIPRRRKLGEDHVSLAVKCTFF